jgi:hypothetical protein
MIDLFLKYSLLMSIFEEIYFNEQRNNYTKTSDVFHRIILFPKNQLNLRGIMISNDNFSNFYFNIEIGFI